MATVITRTQYLEISGVPLATPAWRILDLSRLYGLEVRGEDRLIPGVSGRRAKLRRVHSRVIGLPLLVMGARNHEDTPTANLYVGLDNNIDYLMTNVVNPSMIDDGLKTAVWHRANGNVTASVHVEGLVPESWGMGRVLFTLELSIPAGEWT